MLPDIPDLIRISKALAMLDAILCADWEYRYYSFNSKWDPNDASQMMGSMRNGEGDEYFIWFGKQGAAIKGYWIGIGGIGGALDTVPKEFGEFLREPAFTMDETTFCFWRRTDDPGWSKGNLDAEVDTEDSIAQAEGAEELLSILDGDPQTYVDYARDYFEVEVDAGDVEQVYNLNPLTADLLNRLGSQRTLDELADDIAEIGYPRS